MANDVLGIGGQLKFGMRGAVLQLFVIDVMRGQGAQRIGFIRSVALLKFFIDQQEDRVAQTQPGRLDDLRFGSAGGFSIKQQGRHTGIANRQSCHGSACACLCLYGLEAKPLGNAPAIGAQQPVRLAAQAAVLGFVGAVGRGRVLSQ